MSLDCSRSTAAGPQRLRRALRKATALAALVLVGAPLGAQTISIAPGDQNIPINGSAALQATLLDPGFYCTVGTFQWAATPDGNINLSGFENRDALVTFDTPGTKTIDVHYTGCFNDPVEKATINVSGCEFHEQMPSVDEGSGSAQIRVDRTFHSAGTLSCHFTTKEGGGGASASADYVATTDNLVWPPGDGASKFVSVTILDDDELEESESLDIELSATNGAGTTLTLAQGELHIDDNEEVTVGFFPAALSVGESEPEVIATLRRVGSYSGPFSAEIYTYELDATAGEDFVGIPPGRPLTQTVSFAQGVDSVAVPVTILDDDDPEGDEQFKVGVVAASPGVEIDQSLDYVYITIVDDDTGTVGFESTTATVLEEEELIELVLKRFGPFQGSFEVRLITQDDGAVDGEDYLGLGIAGTPGTPLLFAAGEQAIKVPIPIVDDGAIEQTEDFRVILVSASNVVEVDPGRALVQVSIVDDDATSVGFAEPTQEVPENIGSAAVTLVRQGSLDTSFSVQLESRDATATAGEDYQPLDSVLPPKIDVDFPAGTETLTVLVEILDDEIVEGSESFLIRLLGASDGVSVRAGDENDRHEITIQDDDVTTIGFRTSDATTSEAAGALDIEVERVGDLSGPLQVDLLVEELEATANEDFEVPASVRFAADQAVAVVAVTIADDARLEATERLRLQLHVDPAIDQADAAVDAAHDTVEISIEDNDEAVVGFPAATAQIPEDIGTLRVPIRREGALDSEIQMILRAEDGTATAGQDFDLSLDRSTQTTVTIAAGERLAEAEISILDDDLIEQIEGFSLSLEPTQENVSVEDGAGMLEISIVDDDESAVRFRQETLEVGEGGANATLVVERVGGFEGAFDVDFEVTGDTATEGEDYDLELPTATSKTALRLSFGPGQRARPLRFSILEDDRVEGNESFQIAIVAASEGVTPSPIDATVTIADNDRAVVAFTSAAATFHEDAGTLDVGVVRTGLGVALDVRVFSAPGSARPGSDYSAPATTLHFGAEDQTASFSLQILADGREEPGEQFQLVLGPPTDGAVLGTPRRMEISIVDAGGCRFVEDNLQLHEAIGRVTVQVERVGSTTGTLACRLEPVPLGQHPASEQDTSLRSTPLFWPDGSSDILSVPFEIIDDDLLEETETGELRLFGPGAIDGPPLDRAPLVILDNDRSQQLRFTRLRYRGAEGRPPIEVAVERRSPRPEALSASLCYALANRPGQDDVVLPAAAVSWAGGDEGERIFTVEVVDDDLVEGIEIVGVRLCGVDAPVDPPPKPAALVLVDNDVAATDEESLTELQRPENPVVLYDRSGRRLIVWQAPDGDGLGVWAVRLGRDDRPLGPPRRINQETAGHQFNPTAAIRSDGSFYVAWESQPNNSSRTLDGRVVAYSGSSSILGRGFGSGGEGESEEEELSEAQAAQDPEASSGKTDDVVVTWEGEDDDVNGVVVSSDNDPSAPFTVSDLGAAAAQAATASSASGDFVVIWEENGIRARAFNDRGNSISDEIVVTEATQAAQPSIAMDDEGDWIATWQQLGVAGTDVYAQRFGLRGNPRTSSRLINEVTTGEQESPKVDVNAIGDVAVVWESRDDGVGGNLVQIVTRFLDPNLVALSGDIIVASPNAVSEPRNPDVSIENLDNVTVVFERRLSDGSSQGIFSRVLRPALASGVCESTENGLCLASARFQVTVDWQDFEGNNGTASAQVLTDETGYFWFFNDDNVEVIVKVLDACSVFGNHWVFAAGLTDTEVNLRVDDTLSGQTREYFSPLGQAFATVTDTSAFDACDLESSEELRAAAHERLTEELRELEARIAALLQSAEDDRVVPQPGGRASEKAGTCVADDQTLCLDEARFDVRIGFSDGSGTSGDGRAVPLTADSGYFWFFNDDNVEVIVKVLDACSVFDSYWVFAAGLTDIGTEMTVRDTVSGESKSYTTATGTPFRPILDIVGLPCQ